MGLFIGASILTILELFDYIYEVRSGVTPGENDQMEEHPNSDPNTVEAKMPFHPHEATSPKHGAGGLRRGGRNGSLAPLFRPILCYREVVGA